MRQSFKTVLSGMLVCALLASVPARAMAAEIDTLPAAAIFVTSSGFWEEQENADNAAHPARRGYYKVSAIRQQNGTARIYLQQIAWSESGPQILETAELEEFSAMNAYVTDIRPENSRGAGTTPGLFVTVYLKTSPEASEPETWTILIDELGDMKIERASN